MAEVEINGVFYVTRRLPVIKAWHVGRKICPYLATQGSLALMYNKFPQGEIPDPETFVEAIKLISEVISSMSEADWNYVMNICLGVVQRRDPGTGHLAPVIRLTGAAEQEAMLLFESEWDLTTPYKLTMEVCQADVIPFLSDLLPTLMTMGARPVTPNGAAGDPMPVTAGLPMA